MILFVASGHPPFPLELIFHLITELKKEGLGEDWWQVSQEWDFDSKKFSVKEPVKFQIAERQLLKFYQHGNMARLEGVDHRVLSITDSLLCLNEVYERGMGRTALKEVEKMKNRLNLIEKDCKMNNNLVRSLSDRVHSRKAPRRERPLTG
jgi:hypothetical protein